MTTLKFADTHNMVVFLSKPEESDGFEQIVDFLNTHPIKYALTVNPIIYTSCIEQFWSTVKAKTVNGEVQLQALVDGKKIIVTEASVRSDLQLDDEEGMDCLPNATIFEELTRMGTMASAIICLATNQKFNFSKYIFKSMVKNLENVSSKFLMYPRSRKSKRKDIEVPQPSGPTDNVTDEDVYEEMDDSLEMAATTATSLDAEQDRGNINKTQSKATLNEPSSLGTSSGNTLQSGEDSLKLKELMELCTNLQNRVIDLEKTKTSQAQEITSLKRRVKRLEKKGGSRTHGLKRLYKVGLSRRVDSFDEEGLSEEDASKHERIADIDANAGINLVSTHFDVDIDMFGVHDLVGDEVVVKSEVVVKVASTIPVSATTTTTIVITDDEITLAKTLVELKSAKLPTTTAATTITAASTRPKAKGIVKVQDKGKGIMVEEPLKMKKKDQISFDEQEAIRLQAKFFDEEVRLAREKAKKEEEANIVS
ncbi:hypothetical protein Tco_0071011 [Tanacetum coccineum]